MRVGKFVDSTSPQLRVKTSEARRLSGVIRVKSDRIKSDMAISQHRRAHRIILLVVTVESVILRNLVTRKRHFNQSLEWHRLAILFGRRKMPLLYCIDGSLVQVWIEPTNNLHLINFALVIDCDR